MEATVKEIPVIGWIFFFGYYIATHLFLFLWLKECKRSKDYAKMVLACMDENRRMAMDQLTDEMIHDMNESRTNKDLVN